MATLDLRRRTNHELSTTSKLLVSLLILSTSIRLGSGFAPSLNSMRSLETSLSTPPVVAVSSGYYGRTIVSPSPQIHLTSLPQSSKYHARTDETSRRRTYSPLTLTVSTVGSASEALEKREKKKGFMERVSSNVDFVQ